MIKLKAIAQMTVVAATIVAGNAYAVSPGAYVGGSIGWGKVYQDGFSPNAARSILALSGIVPGASSSSNSNDGVAGRVFAGYQIDSNWGFEAGYSKFSDTKARASATGLVMPVTARLNGNVESYAVDFVSKGTVALGNGFNAYAKLGAAYLNQQPNTTTASIQVGNNNVILVKANGNSEGKIFPTYGLGLSYDISPNLAADISWNRIQKVGNNNLSSTDLVGFGLSYSFV